MRSLISARPGFAHGDGSAHGKGRDYVQADSVKVPPSGDALGSDHVPGDDAGDGVGPASRGM